MPELPEVETVRRQLAAYVVGRTIARVAVAPVRLRAPLQPGALAALVTGAEVVAVRRRAKYLLVDVAAPGRAPGTLLMHLGMSGRLRWQAGPHRPRVHDHVVFTTACAHALAYHDPRRFGLVEAMGRGEERRHPRLVGLGVEPLDSGRFDGAWLYARSRGRRVPIKAFLMNAAVVVGVGNIYASEALFAARVHPARLAGSLSRAAAARLAAATVAVLRRAIAKGGTTLRDFAGADGSAGLFLPELAVYGRAGRPCTACGRPLLGRVLAGRSTVYCGRCQR